MNWLRGFKVVRKFTLADNTTMFRSYIRDVAEGGVSYVIGEITKPRTGCGPLAVFVEKQKALDFIKFFVTPANSFKYQIMPCKYIESGHKKLWSNQLGWGNIRDEYNDVPQGTCFADAVELEAE